MKDQLSWKMLVCAYVWEGVHARARVCVLKTTQLCFPYIWRTVSCRMEEGKVLFIIFFTLCKGRSGFVTPFLFFLKGLLLHLHCLPALLFLLRRCHRFYSWMSLPRCTHLDNSREFSKFFSLLSPALGWRYSIYPTRIALHCVSQSIDQASWEDKAPFSKLWLLPFPLRVLPCWPRWHILCIPGVKCGKEWEAICDLTWPSLIPGNKQRDTESGLMDGSF